ncbi:50S ribosomal protein L7/L12 [Candidatus Bipolaricaulota bacterium]|nr:50S ribosomal protein L7/L12 [Candidatus Bipolaricaulota bacterium]TFH11773.1 MAG: 50S ribosomal protein L7/L12 [Candidatus Atribacteria bacterium]
MAKEDILQQIEELSVKDLAELVEMFEERFNVSAAMAAPVAVAVSPSEGGAAEAASETLKVVMTSAGQKKIQVIKEIKEITGKGLKECKDLADNLPAVIKEGVSTDEATSIREKLEAAGAEVELQ